MITYIRNKPFPNCRSCGLPMGYWVPGLSDEAHEHSECAGKRIAREILQRLTPLALDGGDSAAFEQLSTPEVSSALQGESNPAHRK